MKRHLVAAIFSLCPLNVLAQDNEAGMSAQTSVSPVTPIPSLDVPRYMGTWYEIAKYPNWFQKKCVGNTRADYSLQLDGRLEVVNRCLLRDGEMSEAIGIARQVGSATSAMLEVSFVPSWLTFIPAVWGDYWVIALDDDYQLVAVSEPTRDYLWVLSRTPTVDQKSYGSLLERLQSQGFDLQKLEITRQVN